MAQSLSLSEAYAYCLNMAREHYENFPVASLAMPRRLRPHVAAVYAFARQADDIADEGHSTSAERLESLAQWRQRLQLACEGEGRGPIFMALADTMRRYDLPVQLFHDLLDAFAQDVVTTDYETFDEVLDYCRRSANPVGRIVLALNGVLNDRTAPLSDSLCTGLQLANFWQDISVDRLKPRVYIPREDLRRYAVASDDVLEGRDSPGLRACIAFQVRRTREYFAASQPLFRMLPWRLGIEIRAVWYGGNRILEKIEKQEYTTIHHRPKLGYGDYVFMVFHSLLKGPPHV
jgi:hydroxysqualene synthase